MSTTENGSKALGSLEPVLASADLSAKANHLVARESSSGASLTNNGHDLIAGLIVNGTASGSYADMRPWITGGYYRVYASAAVTDGALLQLDASNSGQLVTATTGPVVAQACETITTAGILTVRAVSGGSVNGAGIFGQPAPVAVNTTATITTTDVVPNAIFTSTTAAAVAATTPTGTQLTAQLPNVGIGQAIRVTLINTGGSNAFTFTAGTDVSVVGAGAVAASSSGTFLLKRTAATTWVAYRE